MEVPTLSFGAITPQTYGGAAFAVNAASASSGAVTYSVVSGPASIAGNIVTATGAGTIVLSANQVANGNYAAATTTTSIPIAAEVPILSFAPVAAQTLDSAPFTIVATSTSSGAVTYSVVSGPATISGSTVTATAAGTVVLGASQAADGNYAAATTTLNVLVNNSTPLASSLAGSASTPPYATSINLVPTFSGGTAMIGSTGAGSSNVTASATSGTSYPTPAVTSATTYTLTVTGTGDNSVSTTFTATPTGVSITPVTPAIQTIAPGQQTFSATASGGATDNLTWSATAGSITAAGVWTSPDVAGTYTITAASVDDPNLSASTTVTVSKPVIITQPMSKNACTGYNPSLTTTASYATSYQWYFNGNPLAVDSPTLTLSNVTTANNGSYSCAAINGAGLVGSNTVSLNVVGATTLVITKQPSSQSVYATQTATFSVASSGAGTLAYQRYTGTVGSGTPISGATSSTSTTAALTAANSGTSYYATMSDPDCAGTTVSSTAAILTVSAADTAVPPTIVVQPIGQTAAVGGNATFAVTASGSGTLKYQWYRVAYSSTELSAPTAGVSISGATSSTYTVPSSYTAQSNDGDNYYVVVTNNYGSAVSSRVVRCRPGYRAPDHRQSAYRLQRRQHAGQLHRRRNLHWLHPRVPVVLVHPRIDDRRRVSQRCRLQRRALRRDHRRNNHLLSHSAKRAHHSIRSNLLCLLSGRGALRSSAAVAARSAWAAAVCPGASGRGSCRRRNRRRRRSHDGVRRPHGRRARCADHYSHRGTRRSG